MKFLSKKDLFGSHVPKAYINKITLESQGHNQPPKISNPHVVPVDRAQFAKFIGSHGAILRSRGAREVMGIDKSESATGIVDSAKELGMKSDPAALTVTLDLVIKDIIKSVPLFRPTESLNIKDFISVCVVQCTTAVDTAEIKRLAKEPGSLSEKVLTASSQKLVQVPMSDIIDLKAVDSGVANNVDVFKEMNERLPIRDIPYRITFDADASGGPLPFQPNYLAYFVWVEFDFQLIADNFDFDTTVLDTTKLLEAMPTLRSRLIYDVVIRSGKVTETAFIFVTDDGAIWTGTATNIGRGKWWTGRWIKSGETVALSSLTRVHKMPDGRWMTGDAHVSSDDPTQSSVFVTRELVHKEIVRNTRIQDFRAIERLEKVNLDFSYIENHLTNNILKTSRMLSEFKTGGDSRKYFSNMYLTRDLNNNCRFIFGLRKDKILEDFSPLRALYREDKISIQAHCPEVSIKLYRVRIKGSPEIGSQTIRRQKPYNFGTVNPLNFNNNNEYEGSYSFLASGSIPNIQTTTGNELIYETLWNGNGMIPVSVDGSSNMNKITNIFTLNDLDNADLSSQDGGVIYFTGVDGTIKNKTDGYYQYKVAFEIKDGSPEYLFGLFNNLKDARLRLKNYYQEASQVNNGNDSQVNNIQNRVNDPHIQHEGRKGYSSFADISRTTGAREVTGEVGHEAGNTVPTYFNVALNRFTRSFIDYANSQPLWANMWSEVVGVYVETIRAVGGDVAATTQDALINYISPQTGNLKGISAVLKLFDNLIGILLRAMKGLRPEYATEADRGHSNTKDNKNVVVQSNIVGQHPPRLKTVKVEHQFDSTFNANLSLNVGLDVLGLLPMTTNINSTSITGLRVVSGYEFQFIVESEIKKIFKMADVPFTGWDDNQQYGYSLHDTSYSYFTPTIIKTPLKTMNLRIIDGQQSEQQPDAQQAALDGVGWIHETGEFLRDAFTAKTISYPLYSFMASNYNLTVVDPENDPQVPIVGPGEINNQIDDTFYPSGINKSFIDRDRQYKKFREQSTIVFSELAEHISPPNIN